jgi:hypothetical protein
VIRTANESHRAHGLLPPNACHEVDARTVQCKQPSFGVATATFRTYPSLDDLYGAYLDRIDAVTGSTRTGYDDCRLTTSSGEISWNHNFEHREEFSLSDVRSGTLDDLTEAAGRVFCGSDDGVFTMVWTQNAGQLLADISGAGFPHEDTYRWWWKVHHAIAVVGMESGADSGMDGGMDMGN